MPKLTIIQTNFNAGELSPDLAGHIDIERYTNGAKTMLNVVPQLAGGGKRRAGSRIIAQAKYPDRTTRLIPFVFNKAQAYQLEVGDLYARFYTAAGQIVDGASPLEIATPYAQTEVFNVEYTQGSDTMFLANESFPIKRLVRLSSAAWSIGDAPFDPGPIDEIGFRPGATLTLSSTAMGAATATSSADVFIASDVGRNIVVGSGLASIDNVVSPTQASITITSAFASNTAGGNAWKLDQSPQAAITPSNSTPIDGAISLTADGPAESIASVSLTGTTMTIVTNDPHGLVVGNLFVLSGFESAGLDGLYAAVTVPDANTVTFVFNGSLLTGGTFGSLYRYGIGSVWRSFDVGSYVSINGGLVLITAVSSPIKAFGKIVTSLSATVTAPASAWSLKSAVWNPVDGYPRAVSLFQQRLYAAGSSNFPETIWGSGTGLYFDFTPGTDDGDSFSYTAASDQVNQVEHLSSSKILVVLTQGEEFSVSGGSSSSVTPTNIDITSQSIFGCAQARPVRVANELIYAQRAGKKIRCMAYDFNTDSFRSQNLTRLAAHITGPGVIDMAFQAEPNPVVWMVRSDGVLASLTYDKDDNVCGFARHTTDGLFKSVCVIPGPDADIVQVVVQRTVNGATVQYIEQFDDTVMTDAAILGTNPAGATVWTGFDLLEGKPCDVKADGVFMGPFTVTGGQITIPRAATSIEVGLHYDSEIETLPPNVSGGLTTSQGNQVKSGDAIVRMLGSINLLVDDQRVAFQEFGTGVLDKAPTPFTGDKEISRFGWDKFSSVTLKQDQPYAWHVLAFIRHFTVNNG
ncbi:hypothetical protein [Caballeronia sp. dw_19]|uniref:hypothetical protein n=1 Tax=Caballeronia sp. dw_19 TaxID=2719791 RepID=UPI00210437BD|nr:hypothetical protein [Caballeronia sp. dw_19]